VIAFSTKQLQVLLLTLTTSQPQLQIKMNHQHIENPAMAIRTSFNNKAAVSKLINDLKSQRTQSALKIESERQLLAANFVPGPYDCICARGKAAASHAGNVRFRGLIHRFKNQYAQANSKVEKSLVVSEIVDAVRGMSPQGGFIKKFGNTWYEVGDSVAREKIGQCLRDALHESYRSSTKAKKNRRKELRALGKERELAQHQPTPMLQRVESDFFGENPFPAFPTPLQYQSSMEFFQEDGWAPTQV
jgi:hypothetical protein